MWRIQIYWSMNSCRLSTELARPRLQGIKPRIVQALRVRYSEYRLRMEVQF